MQECNIPVHDVIANDQGIKCRVGGASSEVQITVPSKPVDKSLLNSTIASTQAKYDAAYVNYDGKVDLLDLAIVARAILQ